MANDITSYLEQIKTASLGEEVRGSIYESIKLCYDDSHGYGIGSKDLEARHKYDVLIARNSGNLSETQLYPQDPTAEADLHYEDTTNYFTLYLPSETTMDDYDYIGVYYRVVASAAAELFLFKRSEFTERPSVVNGIFVTQGVGQLRKIHINPKPEDNPNKTIYYINLATYFDANTHQNHHVDSAQVDDSGKLAGVVTRISGFNFRTNNEELEESHGINPDTGQPYQSLGARLDAMEGNIDAGATSDLKGQVVANSTAINEGKLLLNTVFTHGSRTGGGAPSGVEYRITTSEFVKVDEVTELRIADGFRARFYRFNKTTGAYISGGSWTTGPKESILPDYAYHINIARIEADEDTEEIADISYFAQQVYIDFTDKALSKAGTSADSEAVGKAVTDLSNVIYLDRNSDFSDIGFTVKRSRDLDTGTMITDNSTAISVAIGVTANDTKAVTFTDTDYSFAINAYSGYPISSDNKIGNFGWYNAKYMFTLPAETECFTIQVKRLSGDSVEEADVDTIRNGCVLYTPTDKKLQLSNKAADAEVTGNRFSTTSDTLSTLFTGELDFGDFVYGGINASTGQNQGSISYRCHTGFLPTNKKMSVCLNNPDYTILVALYTTSGNNNSFTRCPTGEYYVDGCIPFSFECGPTEKYYKVCIHRTDKQTMTTDLEDPTSDYSILQNSLHVYYLENDHLDITQNVFKSVNLRLVKTIEKYTDLQGVDYALQGCCVTPNYVVLTLNSVNNTRWPEIKDKYNAIMALDKETFDLVDIPNNPNIIDFSGVEIPLDSSHANNATYYPDDNEIWIRTVAGGQAMVLDADTLSVKKFVSMPYSGGFAYDQNSEQWCWLQYEDTYTYSVKIFNKERTKQVATLTPHRQGLAQGVMFADDMVFVPTSPMGSGYDYSKNNILVCDTLNNVVASWWYEGGGEFEDMDKLDDYSVVIAANVSGAYALYVGTYLPFNQHPSNIKWYNEYLNSEIKNENGENDYDNKLKCAMQFNSENLLNVYSRKDDRSAAGITWKWHPDGSCTINGTATANTTMYLTENKGDRTILPRGFFAGKKYKVNYTGSPVTLRFTAYKDHGETSLGSRDFNNDGSYTLPEEATGCIVYLRIVSGDTCNNVTVSPIMYSNPTNESLGESVDSLFESVDGIENTIDDYESSVLCKLNATANAAVQSGDDLNTYLTAGQWRIGTTSIARSLVNKPDGFDTTGLLTVVNTHNTNHVYQILMTNGYTGIWIRHIMIDVERFDEWRAIANPVNVQRSWDKDSFLLHTPTEERDDMVEALAEINVTIADSTEWALRTDGVRNINSDTIYALWDALQAKYPEYIDPAETIGYSLDPSGSNYKAVKAYYIHPKLKYGNNVTIEYDNMPTVYITAGTHGVEASPVWNLYAIFRRAFMTKTIYSALLKGLSFRIIPCFSCWSYDYYKRYLAAAYNNDGTQRDLTEEELEAYDANRQCVCADNTHPTYETLNLRTYATEAKALTKYMHDHNYGTNDCYIDLHNCSYSLSYFTSDDLPIRSKYNVMIDELAKDWKANTTWANGDPVDYYNTSTSDHSSLNGKICARENIVKSYAWFFNNAYTPKASCLLEVQQIDGDSCNMYAIAKGMDVTYRWFKDLFEFIERS